MKKKSLGTLLKSLVRALRRRPYVPFTNSGNYWEGRYSAKGNSGAGSYGRLAEFKAEVVNGLVCSENIQTILEFGCGDGNQLALGNYPSYIGLDVSPKAIELCKEKFALDSTKSFFLAGESDAQSAELVLSLDVIFHLVEDAVFEKYMIDLFNASIKFVVIYSSNYDDDFSESAPHVRHRRFTDWIEKNASEFEMLKKIPNNYPYNKSNQKNTSFANFYVYKKHC